MKAKDLYLLFYNSIVELNIYNNNESDAITKIILDNYFKINNIDILKNIEINFQIKDIENIYNGIINRLKKYEPIQYIIGHVKFLDCVLKVDNNVLIPRQETEEMVYNILKNNIDNKNILDLCSGSGCISIALKKYSKKSNVIGVDINNNAILLSKENSKINNVDIEYINGDIFLINKIFKDRDIKFDIIVSNPPYVCNSEKKYIKNNVLLYEPYNALFVDDNDPLIFYKQIKNIIIQYLNNGGMFFLEINERFGNDILLLFSNLRFKKLSINKDINGKDRWISGLYYEKF